MTRPRNYGNRGHALYPKDGYGRSEQRSSQYPEVLIEEVESDVLHRRWEAQAAQAALNSGSLVYYILFCCRVKIGFSTNLELRLQNLPCDELLATEPGGLWVERRRHQQFADTRMNGEWFGPSPELFGHILDLREGRPWQSMPESWIRGQQPSISPASQTGGCTGSPSGPSTGGDATG